MATAAAIALMIAFYGTALVGLLKGKWRMVLGGQVALLLLLPFAVVLASLLAWVIALLAAVRLARPHSWWARRFYDGEKQLRAQVRSEPDVQGIAGESERTPEMTFQCQACGRYFPDEAVAMEHADGYHTELAFVDAKAALTRL